MNFQSMNKKKADELRKSLVRKAFVENLPEWPPQCMGFFYQPFRPQKSEAGQIGEKIVERQ